MLQPSEMPVDGSNRFAGNLGEQTQFLAHPEQGDIAQVAREFRVSDCVLKHQVLDDEFNVHHASGIMLDVKKG